LQEREERKPGSVPTGPRPSPEGEDEPKPRPATETPAPAWKPEVTETYRKLETVVNFDTTNRRGGGELSDLASSPLITGDPDSREEKYKRRAPTDWFLRWWKTMMKPAAQRRRGALGWVVVLLLAALALFTLVAVFSYLARGGADDPLLDPMNNPNIRVNGIV